MRKRPNRSTDDSRERAVDEFVQGAKQDPIDGGSPSSDGDGSGENLYPWEKPHVRKDLKKNYPLRLPEPLYLKLKYVSEETGRSMNDLCNEAVADLIAEKVSELT
jgi:hypothetical protein